MKKKLILFMVVLTAISLCACGKSSKNTTKDTKKTVVEKKEEPTIPQVEIQEEVGNGNMYIATPSGTSENGNIPVIFDDGNTDVMQIGLNAFEFDGTRLSYIYVDGELRDKDQLADSQRSIDLDGTSTDLLVGTHTVEVKQYDTDDDSGNIITYKVAQYEVKAE